MTARSAAFTSLTPGRDLARLAAEQDVELLVVDAPDGLLEDARLLALLDEAPCDVAILAGAGRRRPARCSCRSRVRATTGPRSSWGRGWRAAAAARCSWPGRARAAGGRDASRLLANASLAVQRVLGIAAEPVIVEPAPEALVAVARSAGVVVVGLTDRWRATGLGRTRTALAVEPDVTTVLVRRGLRPGGLAPPDDGTRFTWTIARRGLDD